MRLLAAIVVPGGTAWVTKRRSSLLLLMLAGLALLTATVVVAVGGLVGLLSRPWALWLITGSNVAVVTLRLAHLRGLLLSLRACHWEARSPRGRRTPSRPPARRSLLTATVVAATIGPHAAVAVAMHTAQITLVEMLPLDTHPAADPAAERTSTSPARRPAAPAQGLPVTWDGHFDVLVIGLDAGAGRWRARNDANIVVRVEPVTADVTIVSIPRNFVEMPLPDADDECRCFRAPLYALYLHGRDHPHRWPGEVDPGAAAVRDAASSLLGIDIDRYVSADMAAFMDVVDALGGVDVTLSATISDRKPDPIDSTARIVIDASPGTHHLDGGQALALARSRRGTDDYTRMARQRCLLRNLSREVTLDSPMQALRIARSVRGRLVTDIARDELDDILEVARRVTPSRITTLGITPPHFVETYVDGFPVPDLQAAPRALARPGGYGSDTTDGDCH